MLRKLNYFYRFQRIGEVFLSEDKLHQLQKLERTRQQLWRDHSDILNHTIIHFMVSVIYDNALFLTNEEYKLKFPNRKPIDVASTVEHPKLYIIGQSKSIDKDQVSYIEGRLRDLNELSNPIKIQGIPIYDVLRLFSGDRPAGQFEAGQQRGGHFSCICGIRANEH